MINCAVMGGSGYIGGEFIRLLLNHPKVHLSAITANEMAGMAVGLAHPNLSHLKMNFNELHSIADAKTIFLALPHGKAMKIVPKFSDMTIVDTSGDFRLRNKDTYEKYYQIKHSAFEHIDTFTYGLPEIFREQLTSATNIAAPGCFATASILASYPLVKEGLCNSIIINAVTGSSGSGIKTKNTAHHPFRADSFFGYESFTHRHVPEIKQALYHATGHTVEIIFQPHSGPFIRGIYVTAVAALNQPISQAKLHAIYKHYYASEYFIRFTDGMPNVKWVQNTNFCDISVATNGQTAIVMAAIDNLLKGGAAQAIQCFNLARGYDETAGLEFLSANP